ncbi:unnamed protein product, partial [Rotaria sp. Silwood1]
MDISIRSFLGLLTIMGLHRVPQLRDYWSRNKIFYTEVIANCEKYLKNDLYPYLLPKSYDDVEDLTIENWRDFLESEPFRVNAQNQFFVSIAHDSVVRNQLGDVLFRRIERAHKNNEKFRIYIVLPLLPGFDSMNTVQAVLYFIMRSIVKGDNSLFKRLENA